MNPGMLIDKPNAKTSCEAVCTSHDSICAGSTFKSGDILVTNCTIHMGNTCRCYENSKYEIQELNGVHSPNVTCTDVYGNYNENHHWKTKYQKCEAVQFPDGAHLEFSKPPMCSTLAKPTDTFNCICDKAHTA